MPGLRPEDDYNGTPTVNPQVQAPFDTLTARASPQDFGAQIGEGISKVGQVSQDFGVVQEGLANEHAANMASLQADTDAGKILDQYKSMEGLAAANAKDATIANVTNIYSKAKEGLSPLAAKAFDQISTRQLAFSIKDMNTYAADQTKKAYRDGRVATLTNIKDNLGRLDVASDPTQFGYNIGSSYHEMNALFTSPAYGLYPNLPATQQADGSLKFDTSTDEGKFAQANYDQYTDKYIGDAYTTAATTIAIGDAKTPGNPVKAVQFLTSNKDNIPARAYADNMKQLMPSYQGEVIRQDNNVILSDFLGKLNQTEPSSPKSVPNNLANVKTANGKGFQNPQTPQDGAILATNNLINGSYNGLTVQQIANKWTGGDNATGWAQTIGTSLKNAGLDPNAIPDLSNPTVVKAIVKGMSLAEKAGSDRGLFTDDVINQGVDAAFSGQKPQLGNPSTITNNIYDTGRQTEADSLNASKPELIAAARQRVIDRGGDTVMADAAAQRMEMSINEHVSFQSAQNKVMQGQVLKLINDDKNPVTSLAQLVYSGDPNVRKLWSTYSAADPLGANTIEKTIGYNANKEHASGYGTLFADRYLKTLNGQITNSGIVGQEIGSDKDAPMTPNGFSVIDKKIEDMKTPQGLAFAQSEGKFLQQARKTITGAGLPGIDGSKRDAVFNNVLLSLVPQIEAMHKEGKTDVEIFSDPKSPVARAVEANTPTLTQIKTVQGSESIYHMSNPTKTPAAPSVNASRLDYDKINTLADLKSNAAHLTDDQIRQWGVKHGLAQSPPQVPLPQ